MKHDDEVIELAKAQSAELLGRLGIKTASAAGSPKKRGRPARKGVERYANGQIKRSSRREDVTEVAVKNRVRHKGVTLVDARDQRAGTPLGRLQLGGFITEPQALAGEKYLELTGRLNKAEGLGHMFPQAQKVWGAEGVILRSDYAPTLSESDERVDYIARRRAELKALEAFVLERGGAPAMGWLRGLRAFGDDEISIDHLRSHGNALPCIRAVLNILADFFRIGARRSR